MTSEQLKQAQYMLRLAPISVAELTLQLKTDLAGAIRALTSVRVEVVYAHEGVDYYIYSGMRGQRFAFIQTIAPLIRKEALSMRVLTIRTNFNWSRMRDAITDMRNNKCIHIESWEQSTNKGGRWSPKFRLGQGEDAPPPVARKKTHKRPVRKFKKVEIPQQVVTSEWSETERDILSHFELPRGFFANGTR